MAQALIDIQEKRRRVRVETPYYTGYDHLRLFMVPQGAFLDELAAELAPGSVLPEKWGGVETTAAEDPRLTHIVQTQPRGTAKYEVVTHWLEIDEAAVALAGTDFVFTTKDIITDGLHEKIKLAYGIATTNTDAGIPARAKTDIRAVGTLTGATPTAITDYVCRDVRVIKQWPGRVLVVVEYVQFKSGRALSAVVPIGDYYISRGGNSGGGYRRKYGEIEYAIPHALVETYRSMFEPGETTTLTGTFAFDDTTDVLTCGSAVFTAEMVGRLVTATGKDAKTILVFNSTTSVDVDSGGGDWSGVSNARLGVPVWPGDTGAWARRLTDFREIAVCPGRPGFTYVKDIFSVPKASYVVMEDPGQRAIIEVISDPVEKYLTREPSRIIVGSFSQTTTVITCTTSVFAETDEGRVITLTGASPRLITAYISATQVTVASSATVGATANAAIGGRVIEGFPFAFDTAAPYKNKPFFYKVVSGSNLTLEAKTKIRITTADTSLGLSTINALVGTTNDAILTNVGSAAIGTMKLYGVEARREYDIDALWLIKYLFLYAAGGHTCKVDKHIALSLQQKGWWVDPADDVFKESEKYERVVVTMLRPDRIGEDPEVRDLGKTTGDFSNLNGRAAWDT